MKMHGRLALAALLLTAALAVASCGGSTESGSSGSDMQGMDHDEMNGGESGDVKGTNRGTASGMVMEDGKYSDEAFVDAMVPHHRGAVAMAEVALENAEHREIQSLARNIISSQRAEIEEMRSLKEEISSTSDVPMQMSEKDMEDMGMMPDPGELANRESFDEAFIDAMIPHHQSAIQMARIAAERSENPDIQTLAEDIITAQRKEIEQMKTWREDWYPEG